PEELSPVLLGTAAEHLISKKEYAKAEPFAAYLLEHYRDSDFADYGIAAMAEILLDRKKPKDAAKLLQEAIAEDLPRNKEKDIYLLLGRTRLELGSPADLDVAVKVLTDAAARKEWRGEATAWAYFYLGQVEEKRGKENEAFNFYWRCILTRKKFGNVTGKVYLRLIELYQKKGDLNGVRGTLVEMLRPDNPASKTPEADKARGIQGRTPEGPAIITLPDVKKS
ncbi:MAG: hypothetical protein LBV28_03770, partial [Puniceicoccales bacterium]|nr:hypothetical protein [Puniceicoccales bacterium]